jgi:hypothetical protein
MRQVVSFVVVFLLSVGTSFAQEWRTFTSQKDRFSVNLPGEPVVTDIIWETEYGGKLPGRVYTLKQARNTYSVTVVDYNPLRAQQEAKAKDCERGVGALCLGDTAGRRIDNNGVGYWRTDIRGALIYSAFKFLQRDVKVTYYMWNWLGQGPEGHELQLLNNADKSRTFVAMYMYRNWLYILEGTVPDGIPPPIIFQQSISLLEADGTRVRTGRTYYNAAEGIPNEPVTFGNPAPAAAQPGR